MSATTSRSSADVDDAVRAAERRHRVSGAREDEVAWLRERLRAGDLTPERCELAAFVGHPAAATVLERDCQSEAVCLLCYQEPGVLRGLAQRGGWQARLRGALAGGRRLAQEVGEAHAAGGWGGVSERLWHTSRPRDGTLLPGSWPELRAAMDRVLAVATLRALERSLPVGEPDHAEEALRRFEQSAFRLRALQPLLTALRDPGRELDWNSFRCVAQARLFAAIGAELAPWALGYEDPLLRT